MLMASQHLSATHLKGFLCLLAEGEQGRCRGRANTTVVLPQLQQGELGWAVRAGSPQPKGLGVQVTACIEKMSTSKCCMCWLPISIASCIRNK